MVDYYVHRYTGGLMDKRYGPGSGQIWMESLICSGTETSIVQCRHKGWGSGACTHRDDVSVSCIPGILQLTNGLSLKHLIFFII